MIDQSLSDIAQSGTMGAHVSVPPLLSGSLQTAWNMMGDKDRNWQFSFRDLKIVSNSLVGAAEINVGELSVMQYAGIPYLLFRDISEGGVVPATIKAIIDKYQGSWLSLDVDTGSLSPEETLVNTIQRNLITKTPRDYEKYLVDHPVFRDTADLGMSGSLHQWSVELDRDQIYALVSQVTTDLSGTGLTAEYSTDLRSRLAQVSFSGTIGYDPDDVHHSLIHGTMTYSGELIGMIHLENTEHDLHLTLTTADKKSIALVWNKTKKWYMVDIRATDAGVEMGKLIGSIEFGYGKLRDLSLELSAQGMTATLVHHVDGESFSGKLSAAIAGTMSWTGSVHDHALTALHINGQSIFGSLTADLTQSGSLISGPLEVKEGTGILLSANLGLAIARERFAVVFDSIIQEIPVHFDFDIVARHDSRIPALQAPVDPRRYSDLLREIESLSALPEFNTSGSGAATFPQ
jgi:hypothetical protein